jgi:hypothetical protein
MVVGLVIAVLFLHPAAQVLKCTVSQFQTAG